MFKIESSTAKNATLEDDVIQYFLSLKLKNQQKWRIVYDTNPKEFKVLTIIMTDYFFIVTDLQRIICKELFSKLYL